MTTNFIIRQGQSSDATTLARLNATVHGMHVHAMPAFFKEATVEQVAAWFAERMASANTHAWLLEEAGEAVGYALVVVQERAATPFSAPMRRYEIDQIGVVPRARRRGCARRLVDHVCAHARENGAVDVVLKSWTFNRDAHAAFERLGFESQVVQFARQV